MPDFFGALDEYDARQGRHRNPDHATSIEGALDIGKRAGSQKRLLLAEYGTAGDPGLTSEQAAELAGLPPYACSWKRVGELEADGLVELTGEKRKGRAKVGRNVYRITDEGREAIA